MNNNVQTLMISALQHYTFCPRQFALIHVEQVWEDNRFTAEGNILHERVDSGVAEQRKGVRYERSVMLKSEKYGLIGRMYLLEIEQGNPPKYFPVEYKRGKPKIDDWDRIQLCAQALCIEEMRDTTVYEGAIWYWEVRRREPVTIDQELKNSTFQAIEDSHQIISSGKTSRSSSGLNLTTLGNCYLRYSTSCFHAVVCEIQKMSVKTLICCHKISNAIFKRYFMQGYRVMVGLKVIKSPFAKGGRDLFKSLAIFLF